MGKKQIICTVTNDLSYDQRMIRICGSLARAGYAVTLVGRMKQGSVPLKERNFRQKRLRCISHKGKFFYLEYNIRLFFYLLLSKFDIVNAVDLDTILPAYVISILKRKPLVYDAHEYFTEVPEVVRRPRVQKTWKWLEKRTIPNIKYAYTVCQSIAELFEEEYGTKFEVVRNVPLRCKQALPEGEKDPRIILYQGSLNEGRGLEQVIDAMQEVEDAQLWLAGEGDLSEHLRQITKDKQLKNKVLFLGYLQPEELRELTPKVYIGLNLLKNQGLNYYYSLANKSFDYIQALVPSINMDFPEYQRIKNEYEVALLIPDLTRKSILQALHSLLGNDALYLKLKDNCRKAKDVYIWEKEVEVLLKTYRSIPLN